MRVSIDMQMGRIVAGFKELERNQVPFAMAKALTATAKDVQAAEVKEIRDSFDRPTPQIANSIFVRPATKAKLEATVLVKDFAGKGNAPVKTLQAQMDGGKRRLKRFERALEAAGILPPGHYVVPGAAVALDQYGNINPSFIVQLISYFRAFPEAGYKSNMTDKRKAALAKGSGTRRGVAYFVARDGWLHPGIWARYTFGHGSAVKPVLMFVRSVSYEKRFDFDYTAENVAKRVLPGHLAAAWKVAWETARRA